MIQFLRPAVFPHAYQAADPQPDFPPSPIPPSGICSSASPALAESAVQRRRFPPPCRRRGRLWSLLIRSQERQTGRRAVCRMECVAYRARPGGFDKSDFRHPGNLLRQPVQDGQPRSVPGSSTPSESELFGFRLQGSCLRRYASWQHAGSTRAARRQGVWRLTAQYGRKEVNQRNFLQRRLTRLRLRSHLSIQSRHGAGAFVIQAGVPVLCAGVNGPVRSCSVDRHCSGS